MTPEDIAPVREEIPHLRHTIDVLEQTIATHVAAVEQRMTDQLGGEKGVGPNEQTRKRVLYLAVQQDAEYQRLADRLRSHKKELALAEAKLESFKDILRYRELLARERFIEQTLIPLA